MSLLLLLRSPAAAPATAATGTGSLTLSGSGTVRATGAATGSLTLSGSATARASSAANGSLSLTGSAAAQARGAATGSLSLSGSGAAHAVSNPTYQWAFNETSGTTAYETNNSGYNATTGSHATFDDVEEWAANSATQPAVSLPAQVSPAGFADAYTVMAQFRSQLPSSGVYTLMSAPWLSAITINSAGQISSATLGVIGTVGAMQSFHLAASTESGPNEVVWLNGVRFASAETGGGTPNTPLTLGSGATAADRVFVDNLRYFQGLSLSTAVVDYYRVRDVPTATPPTFASGTGSLSLSGSATARATAVATGSLTLDGSVNARSTALASGSITLTGINPINKRFEIKAPVTATASLDLTGTAATSSAGAAAGALALTGAGTGAAATSPTASLTLAGTGTTRTASTASGSLTLNGSGAVRTVSAASGSLVLTGTGGGSAAGTATGSLTLAGSGAARAAALATASLTLTGSADQQAPGQGSGALTLSGTVTARSTGAGTASLALSGAATSAGSAPGTGAISLSAEAGASSKVFTFDTLPAAYGGGDVVLDNGTLRSDGNGSWWFMGDDWSVSGDFTVFYDLYFPDQGPDNRDIANFAFYALNPPTTAGGDATYHGLTAYALRLQSSSLDGGFYRVSGTQHVPINAALPPVPRDLWLRVQLVVVAGIATATVRNRATSEVISSLTQDLGVGNRSGTFGQHRDGAGSALGHRWDNLTTQQVAVAASAVGTGSLTLSAEASAAGQTPVAASANISLSGSASTRTPSAASASLGLAGSAAGDSRGSAQASITLTASATADVRAQATGSIALTAQASAAGQTPTGGAANLSLSGAGVLPVARTATASMTLTATAAMRAVAGGSASIEISATGAARVRGLATGTVTLTATGTGGARGGATSTLDLSGLVTPSALAGGTGSLHVAGTGTAVPWMQAVTGQGFLVLTASGTARAKAPPFIFTGTLLIPDNRHRMTLVEQLGGWVRFAANARSTVVERRNGFVLIDGGAILTEAPTGSTGFKLVDVAPDAPTLVPYANGPRFVVAEPLGDEFVLASAPEPEFSLIIRPLYEPAAK